MCFLVEGAYTINKEKPHETRLSPYYMGLSGIFKKNSGTQEGVIFSPLTLHTYRPFLCWCKLGVLAGTFLKL